MTKEEKAIRDAKRKAFNDAVMPAIKYLFDNHPTETLIITAVSAELLSREMSTGRIMIDEQ